MTVTDPRIHAQYGFDELVAGGYTQIADAAAGARHLAAASVALAPKICSLLNGVGAVVDYARVTNGNATTPETAFRAGDAGSLAICQASHTLEWVGRAHALGARGYIIAYGGTGDVGGAPTNHQTSLILETTGKPTAFWEYSSGTNEVITQSGGATIVVGKIYYVAVSINRVTKVCRFAIRAIDGSISFVSQAYVNQPTGGGDSSVGWRFAHSNVPAGLEPFAGATACLRVWPAALSDAEMTANSDVLLSTLKLPAAGAHTCWLMNEAPDVKDRTKLGMHLHVNGANSIPGADPLVNDGGAARWFGGSTHADAPDLPDPNATATTAMFQASFSVSWASRLNDPVSALHGVFNHGFPGPEDAPNNFIGFEFHTSPARSGRFYSENGAGADAITTSPTAMTPAEAVSTQLWMLRVTRGVTTAIDLYRGKTLIHSATGLVNFDGGSADFLRVGWGPAMVSLIGMLDELTFWKVALTESEWFELVDLYEDDEEPVVPTPSPAPAVIVGVGHGGLPWELD